MKPVYRAKSITFATPLSIVDRANDRYRAQLRHQAQVAKLIATQALADRIAADHAAWVAAGEPEYHEGDVA